jgi:hypothetical protein
VGPIEHLVRSLLPVQHPAQVVVLCGRSEALNQRIDALVAEVPPTSQITLRPVSYTSEMDEYMAATDLMVGKPGGLTTSEALSPARRSGSGGAVRGVGRVRVVGVADGSAAQLVTARAPANDGPNTSIELRQRRSPRIRTPCRGGRIWLDSPDPEVLSCRRRSAVGSFRLEEGTVWTRVAWNYLPLGLDA